MHALEREVTAHYPKLGAVEARLVYSSVHEMVEVRAAGERYALKLYRPGVRSVDDVKWETALHRHLLTHGAPVAELITGTSGDVEAIEVSGAPRVAVLSAWAPGSKPSASEKTYRLVGRAAAEIHAAADSFSRALDRTPRDLTTELRPQMELLRPALEEVGRWNAALTLAERLEGFVSSHRLQRGQLDASLAAPDPLDDPLHAITGGGSGASDPEKERPSAIVSRLNERTASI